MKKFIATRIAQPRSNQQSESASKGGTQLVVPSSGDTETQPAFGLKILAQGSSPNIDIVAVHGLNGHRETTWTAKNGKLWLKDLLPAKIPNARILSWGYDANTHGKKPLTSMYLYDHARELVSDLSLERRLTNTTQRPIVFVAHSLGGIVVKSALLHSNSTHPGHLKEHRAIKTSTYGIIFMGTPHQGSESATWGMRLVGVASIFVHTNDSLLKNLAKDSEILENVLAYYAGISSDFVTKFAYETYPTPLAMGKAALIVPKSSAVIPGAVDAEAIAIMDNHLNMVKYLSEDDSGFRKIAGHLTLMAEDASTKISRNWEREGNLQISSDGYRVSVDLAGSECLRALFVTNPEDDKASIEIKTYRLLEESCAWIFEEHAFLTWLKEDQSPMLWIHGDPGKGKSMLMIAIIAKLSVRKESPHNGFVFFFCDAADERRRTAISALRGIIYQLICQHPRLLLYLQREYDRERDYLFSSPNALQALWRILQNMLADPVLTEVYIMIDALDECDLESLDEFLVLIKRAVQSTQKSCTSKSCRVKWLCTSRNVFVIQQRMGEVCLDIGLESHASKVAGAVTLFIDSQVKDLAQEKGYNHELREYVRNDLHTRAGGTFLWVAIVCLELRKPTVRSFNTKSTLQNLPSGLRTLYDRILEQVTSNEDKSLGKIAEDILCSASIAVRPLRLQELAIVAGLPPEYHNDLPVLQEYIEQCGPFLTVVQGAVHFIHQSVKDYLLTPLVVPRFSLNVRVQHQVIATRCFQYICNGAFTESFEEPDSHVEYPLVNWLQHVQKSELDMTGTIDIEANFFQPGSRLRDLWFHVYWKHSHGFHGTMEEPCGFTPLHLAACSGTFWLAQKLLSCGHSEAINSYDSLERTPLHWAAHSGSEAIAELLLTHGAEIEARGGKRVAALHEVGVGGGEACLRFLLLEMEVNSTARVKIDFRAQGGYQRTALHLAGSKGHDAVVRLLLENNADIEASDHFGWTTLHGAASGGHQAVLQTLLEKRVDVSARTVDGWTALHGAASGGHTQLVQMLLNKGSLVNARTHRGRTPLHGSAWGENPDTVHHLLEKGAEVDAQDSDGEIALHVAAGMANESTVQLLLDQRANLDIRNVRGSTASHLAASNGHHNVWHLLQESGADVKIHDYHGQSMLHNAAFGGSDILVKKLIAMGMDVNAKDEDGRTALHMAAGKGYSVITELLLESGADIGAIDQHEVTVLHDAASGGDHPTFLLLLQWGADMTSESKDGETVLHRAAFKGCSLIVRTCLERGASIQAANAKGLTAIQIAVERGYEEVVLLLQKRGAELNAVDANGMTLLHRAVCGGSIRVVQLMLNTFSDIEAKGLHGQTALHMASARGHTAIVKLLLDNQINYDSQADNVFRPLHYAAFSGHHSIVQLLLTKGSDVQAQTEEGETALHYAVMGGHDATAWLLVERWQANVKATMGNDITALHIAAEKGHIALVQLFLRHGADGAGRNTKGQTALHLAALESQEAVIRVLLDKMADPDITDQYGRTALHLAAEQGCAENVELLIKKGADVGTRAELGWTALHYAAANGHKMVVRLLLDKNSDVKAELARGSTALHVAVQGGHNDVVKTLIEAGADLDARTKAGYTPLHLGALDAHSQAVGQLLHAKASVNQRSDAGLSPLHMASMHGHLLVAEQLLDAGADPNEFTKSGITCLHAAVYAGHTHVVKLLLQADADPRLVDGFGRTSLDWAMLHRPLFREMIPWCESYVATPESDQKKSLHRFVGSLVERWIRDHDANIFHFLGHSLILLQDSKEAQKAFQHDMITDPETLTSNHRADCSLCSANETIEGKRYICNICPDFDLCSSCMERYQDNGGTVQERACHDHTFLEVPQDDCQDTIPLQANSSDSTIREWLQHLVRKYPSP